MTLQEQLAKPQRPVAPVDFSQSWMSPSDIGLLGNKSIQSPATLVSSERWWEIFRLYFIDAAVQPISKLALLQRQKFTPAGKESRITASIAALNAAQPTNLTLAQWKEIVEEVEEIEE